MMRYLARRFPNELGYEHLGDADVFKIDANLDQIHRKVVWGSEDERKVAMKEFATALKSRQSLMPSGNIGVVDYALWSAVLNGDGKAPGEAKRWSDAMAKLTGLSKPIGRTRGGKENQAPPVITID